MKTSKITLKFIFAFAALAMVFTTGNAQVHVASDGDVGVGTTSPGARLHVLNGANTSTYSAYFYNLNTWNSSKYGIYNYISGNGTGTKYALLNYAYNDNANTSSTYGVNNYVNGAQGFTRGEYAYTYQPTGATGTMYGKYNYVYTPTSSTGYGLYNYAYSPTAASGNRYGIYNVCNNYGTGATTYALYSSVNTGSGTRYAGYFNGDVHVQGNLTWTSDERTKKNIDNLDGALALIDQLQPKSYEFKDELNMNLPTGKQYGFVAQELEQTLPGLVKTVEHPATPGELAIEPMAEEAAANGEAPEVVELEEGATTELKAVNYVALIPVLVQAIKEQQQEIEALKEQLKNK